MNILPLPERIADIDINPQNQLLADVIDLLLYIKNFLSVDEYVYVVRSKTWLEEKREQKQLGIRYEYDNLEKYRYEFNGIFERTNKKSYGYWLEFEREIIEKQESTS
jgi:hypothetical protein